MAELNTIARPYARAAFETAQASGALAAWGALLQSAASAVEQPEFELLIGNPQVETEVLASLLDEITGKAAGESGSAFLALLAQRNRLLALPAIMLQFEALRAVAENRADVEVISAVPLTDEQQKAYAKAMQRRLGRDVVIHPSVDTTLLGGAIIRAGDLVIDGSVKGRLAKLAASL
ncbi:MAG: F0F1 ATP synthase subunit delta [Gammaproteobacteria bacterium]